MERYVIKDCDSCALTKKFLEIKVDHDDTEVYSRILTMLDNSTQATSLSSLQNLPENISDKDKKEYIDKAKKNEKDARHLLAEWWNLMLDKYKLPTLAVKFDGHVGKFYVCYREDGTPDMNGGWTPKKKN